MMIAVTMLSMALPIVRPALERGKVNSAASVVASDLQYAVLTAVRSGRPVAVIVDPSSKQILIRDRADATTVYRTRQLGSDTEFTIGTLASSPTTNEAFPNGILSSGMTITLTLNGFSREVTLSRAGQVRVVR